MVQRTGVFCSLTEDTGLWKEEWIYCCPVCNWCTHFILFCFSGPTFQGVEHSLLTPMEMLCGKTFEELLPIINSTLLILGGHTTLMWAPCTRFSIKSPLNHKPHCWALSPRQYMVKEFIFMALLPCQKMPLFEAKVINFYFGVQGGIQCPESGTFCPFRWVSRLGIRAGSCSIPSTEEFDCDWGQSISHWGNAGMTCIFRP